MSMGAHKSESYRLVQHGFSKPLVPKWKYSEEKIYLCYRMIKVQISGGLLTDYFPYSIVIEPRSLQYFMDHDDAENMSHITWMW